jgi:hypothetical protein
MARVFADVTAASDPVRIDAALSHVLITYDKRQARGRSYNPYAIAHYCEALQRARALVEAGKAWRAALVECFNGRLLDNLLKAIQEAPSTRAEQMY